MSKFQTLAELKALYKNYRPDWLIEGFLEKGTVNILHAPAKQGKSTFAYTLAAHVQLGKPFLGKKVSKNNVLWLAFEERATDILLKVKESRLEAPITYDFTRESLDDLHVYNKLKDHIQRENVALLIVDPILGAFKWGDTWKPETVRNTFQQYLISLADSTGVSILLLHHNNKTGGMTGSEQFNSCCHTIISFSRNKESNVVTLKFEGRNSEGTIQLASPNKGQYTVKGSQIKGMKHRDILPIIKEAKRICKSELMKQSGLSKNAVAYKVKALGAQVKETKVGREVFYEVAA